MNKSLEELLDAALGLSYEEKVELGKKCLRSFEMAAEEKGLDEEQISEFVVEATKLFVSADLDCGIKEFQFFKDVTGIKDVTYDEFYDGTNNGADDDFIEYFFNKCHELGNEGENGLVGYGLALLTVDRQLKDSEVKLFLRFFGEE